MKRIYLVPTVLMGCVSLTFAQKKESDTIKSDIKLKDIEEVVMVGYGSQKDLM
jgi:iron complex outermembrane receptor protein